MSPSAVSTPFENIEEELSNGDSSFNRPLNGVHLNGHTNRHSSSTTPLSSSSEVLDLICVGFGPASLAIAIALHDAAITPSPKALFLEKQAGFAWHAGMQLPGAKMQISFLKDLATPRNPRSKFTFLNYLFDQGRLNQFINLGTFLPSRLEYEDYLRWCAAHFEREGKVAYGMAVESVVVAEKNKLGRVTSWDVIARSESGDLVTRRARHVVVAVGGRPVIPQNMRGIKHVAHSSQYGHTVGRIQEREEGRKLRFAVVGGGQSAAEIFNDLWTRFPGASVRLIIKGANLRPSDDSPFVNEIFDPDRVDGIYSQPDDERTAALTLDRGTNYGVVRLTLLEHIYEKIYMQRLTHSSSSPYPAQIISNRAVLSALQTSNSSVILKLADSIESKRIPGEEEDLEVDYVFTATGYTRNAHEEMLSEVKDLLPGGGEWHVGRDYRVKFQEGAVDESAGVWLQGCNEKTHGLSDTLLSILSVRGGELVESVFGEDVKS
ncbi:related to L-ornithine N5-hydroxylase [Rhynchosporium agropyri]|uniref:L-ornithine N(5)-monooxygenase [NAD(P)H] n=1 Tax=Rhynchosporium agropyri TaxID=914238 RepID=A0A1E1JTI1_9HELO|nr:related to L-ornithine N5-hydroxylase [Rhynchosporium agropyri]